MSQALRAGGHPMVGGMWYFTDSTKTSTTSWYNVDLLSWNMTERMKLYRAEYWQILGMNQAYSPARSGDIYLYDAGNGVYTHMTMSTGYGTFPSKVDPYLSSLRYDGVTGGVGDYMNGHTRERERAPWNIGYWEATTVNRGKMNTVIMHMFDTF